MDISNGSVSPEPEGAGLGAWKLGRLLQVVGVDIRGPTHTHGGGASEGKVGVERGR